MVNLFLEDDQYEKQEINHTRLISRGVVIDNNNRVAILHVIRDDMFGKYDYYELPGGLNENETPEDGAIREIHEELGVISHVINKIGVVEDFYNLINRKNINNYYLLKVDQIAHQHLELYESLMIQNVLWVNIDDAINYFNDMPNEGVSLLVKRRELPILFESKKMIDNI